MKKTKVYDLKSIINQTFGNLYQISLDEMGGCKSAEAIKGLEYLQDVCANVDKYFAYEYVFQDWQERAQQYIDAKGEKHIRWVHEVERLNKEDFEEWARRRLVDTPAEIVYKNVRYAVHPKIYGEFSRFCSVVENYLCYRDIRHPKHLFFYAGEKRLYEMIKPFVSVTNNLASKCFVNRMIGKIQLSNLMNNRIK